MSTGPPAKIPRRSTGGKQSKLQQQQAAVAAAASAAAAAAVTAASVTTAATALGSNGVSSAVGSNKDKINVASNVTNNNNNNNLDGSQNKDGKDHFSRSYPRGVGIDFRKLSGLTLLNYIDHHGVPVRPEAPPSELAVAVARHFEVLEVDEEEAIGGFLERLENGVSSTTRTEYCRSTGYFDGYQIPLTVRKRQRNKFAARPGEQVAAKVTRTDENGSWILASVQRFYNDTETYDVQDEDDTSKVIRLPWNHVMRLSLGGEGIFNKGTECMAIFPETTSFYRAKISKQPVWKIETGNNGQPNFKGASNVGSSNLNTNLSAPSSTIGVPLVKEMIVKFEDDEDDTGKTPHRRVPARYVIPLPNDYFYDETDDVDVSLAIPSSAASSQSKSVNISNNTTPGNVSVSATSGLPSMTAPSVVSSSK